MPGGGPEATVERGSGHRERTARGAPVAWEMDSRAPAPSHTARRCSASRAASTYRPAGAVYRARRPTERSPLVVQHHLETFLAEAQEADSMGWGVPAWVERDFRSYLRCGILAHGFARIRCSDCGHNRLLAFSCKGRGVCPSCNARRMADVAAHLTDEVVPHLLVRQWVLSVPKRLRPFLHQTPQVARGVLGIFLRALRSTSMKPPASRPAMQKPWPARCSFAPCGGSPGVASWTPPRWRTCRAHAEGGSGAGPAG
ncbi:MAG: hypothetical protein EA422_11025 [Gemmatimonadales bacterium]|nr:MAG: hypothetical protein EA422_11025 [Gemmatimonadales bacterium]